MRSIPTSCAIAGYSRWTSEVAAGGATIGVKAKVEDKNDYGQLGRGGDRRQYCRIVGEARAGNARCCQLAKPEVIVVRRSLVLLVLTLSGAVHAQSAGAQAEALFRQGRELASAGKFSEACSAFEESQRLEPTSSTLLNLASCREMAGELATAWGLFLDVQRQTRNASDVASRKFHDVAAERSQKLEGRLSKLTISVPDKSKVDQLEILRNKQPVPPVMWNRAFPLDGGTYTISARAPGSSVWTTEITLAPEADSKSVEIPDLKTLPADLKPDVVGTTKPTPRSVPTPNQPGTSRSYVAPIAVGAGALVLLGGALGFELSARSTFDDAKAEMMDQARRDELHGSANTRRYIAQGLAVAGAGCAGVAIWLFLRGRSNESTTTTTATLVVSPNGFAIARRF